MKKLIIILLLTACGSKEEVAQLQQKTTEPETNQETTISFFVSAKDKLPECNLNIENQLAYVKESAEFYSCDGEAWSKASIKGQDGKDGQDGVDGQDGQDGAQGVAGNDGDDAFQMKLVSSLGDEIGNVVSIDSSTNRYWVVMADKTRIEVNRNGTLSTTLFYFSGANCTGERRMARTNGMFANAQQDPASTKVFKTKGAYANNWAYASRNNGSCLATSGTINRAYAVDEITIPGLATWGEVEIID